MHDEFYSKFSELDTKFNFEKVMDMIIEQEKGHRNADLFEQIFDQLDDLRSQQTLEESF